MNFIHWIKEHKLLAFISLAGIFILYRIFSSSGSSTAASTQPTSAQVQADAALGIAQLQSNTQLGLAGIGAGVAGQQISAGQNIGLAQTAASVTNTTTAGNVQLGVAGDQTSVANNSTNATLQASLAQTAALEAIALAPYQVELAQLNSQSGAGLADLQHQIANIASLTSSAIENVSGTVTTGNYPIQLAQNAGSDLTQLNAIAAKYGTSGVNVAGVMPTQGYTAVNTH